MYSVEKNGVFWRGKRLKNVTPEGFEILTPHIARTAHSVFMRGKDTGIKSADFDILSDSYARDDHTVYVIMPSKLKPLKGVDASRFVALGTEHGADHTRAFFRDKPMRLGAKKTPADLRPLGWIFASDGTYLYHGTQRFPPPSGADLTAKNLRFQAFDREDETNLPAVALCVDDHVWTRIQQDWALCEGADFDTLAMVRAAHGGHGTHVQDARSVWYEGRRLDGAQPGAVFMIGQGLLSDGARLWFGAQALEATCDEVAFVDTVFDQEAGLGVALHHGDRIDFYGENGSSHELARADLSAPMPDLAAVLREIFATLFTVFSRYAALHWAPSDIFADLKTTSAERADLPAFEATLCEDGTIVVTMADGAVFKRRASAWYSLACDLWDHQSFARAGLRPYPQLGAMLPEASYMHQRVMGRHQDAFYALMQMLWAANHRREASVLAHFLCALVRGRADLSEGDLRRLVGLPKELVAFLHYEAAHHRFEATTNLAVSRLIMRDNWLNAEDFRDQIDAIDTLHGAMLETSKIGYVWAEIIPDLMARYDAEPCGAIKELLAYVLEAALIRGQVACEVHRQFFHAEMLPVIRFCIQNGINVIYNRARLAEALWATDQGAQGDAQAAALIADIGDDAPLAGVYCNRLMYRTARLWFLRGKCDIAWRDCVGSDTHARRLDRLEAELADVIARYGAPSAKWEEIRAIREDIARYRAAGM